jgi:hypothetical protein
MWGYVADAGRVGTIGVLMAGHNALNLISEDVTGGRSPLHLSDRYFLIPSGVRNPCSRKGT